MSRRRRAQPQRWTNWAGNQQCAPSQIARPLTEAQLRAIVRDAANSGRRVRAVASGHSFTAIACTNDVLLSLDRMNQVRSVDRTNGLVTVDAGIELRTLNARLAKHALAMTNLGDIAYQSVAGAVSTGTHGTGLAFGGLATQLRGLRIVTATGDVLDCNATENAEVFHAARVGLGALGIISRATIAVEPAFNLHAIEEPHPIDDVLDRWNDEVASHDHYEFFWIPGTRRAMTKTNRRTSDPAQPLPRLVYLRNKIGGENVAFGAMAKAARHRPSLVPRLSKLASSGASRLEYTDASHKVFASPRWVKFVEMEYSVPLADLPVVVRKIGDAVKAAGWPLIFPIEARAAAADDIPLSTAQGRDSGYVAVHRVKGRPFREYFETVEAIVADHAGRPHWGKMHFHTAATLSPLYPEWEAFQSVRRRLDPAGLFTNDYIDRVLGPAL